jgi:hypothetical protein
LNANGSATVTVVVQDNGGTANGGVDKSTNTFTISVTPVNDAPSVTFSITNATNTVIAILGTGPVTNTSFAAFSPGPANESSQTLLGYTVTVDQPSLFAVLPAIDNSGTLTFVPTNIGTVTVTVVVQDSGGTANGGVDKSTNTFTIVIKPLEVPSLGGIPSFSLDALNTPARKVTNAVPVSDSLDPKLVKSAEFDLITKVLKVIPVGGQDGSTNRTTVMVQVQFDDGTSQTIPIEVLIYQPLLTTVPSGFYNSSFGTPIFNRQTSLYEQHVVVSNNTPFDFTALRITATNLPPTITLRNSTLATNGFSYIEYLLTVPSGGSVTLMLEYFNASRGAFPPGVPGLKLELLNETRTVTPPAGATPTGVSIYPGYTPAGAPSAKYYIEFQTVLGRRYYVQYKDAVGDAWKTSPVIIIGTGGVLNWQDAGPPNTETPPGPTRFYQIIAQ